MGCIINNSVLPIMWRRVTNNSIIEEELLLIESLMQAILIIVYHWQYWMGSGQL